MPRANRFRHQTYTDRAPASSYQLLQAGECPAADTREFGRRMARVGETLREAGVAAVYLVHGTFAGADATGFLSDLGRFLPGVSEAAQRTLKQVVDGLFRDAGNYTEGYAERLETSLAAGGATIPVRRFHWSSENNHIGRADGGVRLIDELLRADIPTGSRVLLWGHSHAGNVFALTTNLLGGDKEDVEAFFATTAVYNRRSTWHKGQMPHWRRVHQALLERDRPLEGVPLDFVTFGTPIRYGWDADGYANLLHFIHHKHTAGLPPYRVPFPPEQEDVLSAASGDYVQQLAIAGTNLAPSVFSWRAFLADARLNAFLQAGHRRRDLLGRLRAGMRVPSEGTALLVDYGPQEGNVVAHLAGHAVYTKEQWMLFHGEEVAERFYTGT